MPSDAPVKFGELGQPTSIADAGPNEPVTVGQSTGDGKPAEVKLVVSGDVSAGRELFNGTCAHCHGPDAVQAEKRINLRLLKKRYGDDDMESTYWKTVHDGRPSKGMPASKEVYGDDELRNVLAYLQTLQEADGSN